MTHYELRRMPRILGGSHSEPSHKSKVDLFLKTANSWKSLTIFAEKAPPQILDWALNTPPRANYYFDLIYNLVQ